MSSSNISKWFPRVSQQQTNDKVFLRTKWIERELKILANKFTTNINFNLLDYYVSYKLNAIFCCFLLSFYVPRGINVFLLFILCLSTKRQFAIYDDLSDVVAVSRYGLRLELNHQSVLFFCVCETTRLNNHDDLLPNGNYSRVN